MDTYSYPSIPEKLKSNSIQRFIKGNESKVLTLIQKRRNKGELIDLGERCFTGIKNLSQMEACSKLYCLPETAVLSHMYRANFLFFILLLKGQSMAIKENSIVIIMIDHTIINQLKPMTQLVYVWLNLSCTKRKMDSLFLKKAI